jgi:hypothetical protein
MRSYLPVPAALLPRKEPCTHVLGGVLSTGVESWTSLVQSVAQSAYWLNCPGCGSKVVSLSRYVSVQQFDRTVYIPFRWQSDEMALRHQTADRPGCGCEEKTPAGYRIPILQPSSLLGSSHVLSCSCACAFGTARGLRVADFVPQRSDNLSCPHVTAMHLLSAVSFRDRFAVFHSFSKLLSSPVTVVLCVTWRRLANCIGYMTWNVRVFMTHERVRTEACMILYCSIEQFSCRGWIKPRNIHYVWLMGLESDLGPPKTFHLQYINWRRTKMKVDDKGTVVSEVLRYRVTN